MFFSRGKNKVQNPYTLNNMYKEYIKDKEINSPYYISYNQYISITTSYLKKLITRLYEGFKVVLPYSLGGIQIVKKQMYYPSQINKKRGINWKETNKYGKIIHHLNEHSNGYKYLFYWDRSKSRVKNSKCYRFIPTRTLKRTLAELVIVHRKDYFEAH